MDAYLSKPVDVDELVTAVERFGTGPAGERPASGVQPAGDPVFDERAALAFSGGDRRLLQNVVRLFRSDYPNSLRRIDTALQSQDREALRLAAHGLKGAIATVGASAGREAAAELERTAHSGSFEEAGRASVKLRHEIDRLEAAFAAAGLAAPRARRSTARGRRRAAQRKRRAS